MVSGATPYDLCRGTLVKLSSAGYPLPPSTEIKAVLVGESGLWVEDHSMERGVLPKILCPSPGWCRAIVVLRSHRRSSLGLLCMFWS